MVGDQNHALSNNFEVLREGVGLADRGTFVLDPAGEIQLLEITPEGVGRNTAELLRKIKALQYWVSHPGEVCPAKWEEGADTLAPSLDLVGKIYRSDEHTSELQSLIRISYAVFCLKKKNTIPDVR